MHGPVIKLSVHIKGHISVDIGPWCYAFLNSSATEIVFVTLLRTAVETANA